MKLPWKRKSKEPSPEYQEYLLQAAKWREEDAAREKKENERSAGDLCVAEVKTLIRKTIEHESWHGNLPLLNRQRKRFLERSLWKLVLLSIVGVVIYWNWWRNTDYSLHFGSQERLFVTKVTDGDLVKSQIKLVDKKWRLCNEGGEGCSEFLPPLEASYNRNYKFIFTGGGRLYWIKNDRTEPKEVRQIDGAWSYKDADDEDGWVSFDELREMSYDPEPADR